MLVCLKTKGSFKETMSEIVSMKAEKSVRYNIIYILIYWKESINLASVLKSYFNETVTEILDLHNSWGLCSVICTDDICC